MVLSETQQGLGHAGEAQSAQKEPLNWAKSWHPVTPLTYLDATRPTPIKLLGKPLVLWRDGGGKWKCFQDACPHRLAPLSEGRVEPDGTLMCSYHGWRLTRLELARASLRRGMSTLAAGGIWNGQAEDPKSAAVACGSKRACVTSYPVSMAGGLLWVWPDASSSAAGESAESAPRLPRGVHTCLEQGGSVQWYMRDLPYSYDTLLENLADPSHLPFSHHKLEPVVRRDTAIPLPMRAAGGAATELSPMERELLAPGCDPEWALQYPSMRGSSTGNWGATMLFNAPSGMMNYDDTTGRHLILYAVPTERGRSRLIQTAYVLPPARPPSLLDVGKAMFTPQALSAIRRFIRGVPPAWRIHLMNNRILDQDGPFLAMQEQRLLDSTSSSGSHGGPSSYTSAWSRAYYMPTAADKPVVNMRRWLEGAGSPYAGPATARATREATRREMLDRYEQHTKHCPDCKQQLAKTQRLLNATAVAGVAFFSAMCGVLAVAAVGGLAANGWAGWVAAAAALGMAVCTKLHDDARKLADEFTFTDFVHADWD